jgi:hypothetical protein
MATVIHKYAELKVCPSGEYENIWTWARKSTRKSSMKQISTIIGKSSSCAFPLTAHHAIKA